MDEGPKLTEAGHLRFRIAGSQGARRQRDPSAGRKRWANDLAGILSTGAVAADWASPPSWPKNRRDDRETRFRQRAPKREEISIRAQRDRRQQSLWTTVPD